MLSPCKNNNCHSPFFLFYLVIKPWSRPQSATNFFRSAIKPKATTGLATSISQKNTQCITEQIAGLTNVSLNNHPLLSLDPPCDQDSILQVISKRRQHNLGLIYKHWRNHILTPIDNDQSHCHKSVDALGPRGRAVHILNSWEPTGRIQSWEFPKIDIHCRSLAQYIYVYHISSAPPVWDITAATMGKWKYYLFTAQLSCL
jgi:hypothetical protein